MASISSALFHLKMLRLQPPWFSVTSVILFKSSFFTVHCRKKKKKKDLERLYMLRRLLQTEAINWCCTARTRKPGDVNWRSVFENVVNKQSLKASRCSRLGWGHWGFDPGSWAASSLQQEVRNLVPSILMLGESSPEVSYIKVICDYS